MFSGIIEEVGSIATVREREGAKEFQIRCPGIIEGLGPGDSVSVDGACQTVVSVVDDAFTVESIGTTLSRTIMGDYRIGSPVNLERAMLLGERLHGHLVQGHVDGVGEHVSTRKAGDFWLLDFRIPDLVSAVTILHGSIAINGISLTVNALASANQCQVGIIPFTWEHTNLKVLRPGDKVNLEGDLIGKYVGKMLSTRDGANTLSLDNLEELGF